MQKHLAEPNTFAIQQRVNTACSLLDNVREEIGKIIAGQQEVVDGVLICLIAGGHVLLEGVPGLGKTTLLRTLARTLDLQYSRIQFTPDLMPADIVGSMMMDEGEGCKQLRFQRGPIFANLVLTDEINRATPKTQSALLEAMQELTVTCGTATHDLQEPFLVMATQNPIEMEGTYPLPEAQLDRFLMKIQVNYPSREDLNTIVHRSIQKREPTLQAVLDRDKILEIRTVCRRLPVQPAVREFAVDLVMATQPDGKGARNMASRWIRYGSSPRGAQALIECARVKALLSRRYEVGVADITAVVYPILRHRIILNFDAHADGETTDGILAGILRESLDNLSPQLTAAL
jgi:MoxR-like ATPase